MPKNEKKGMEEGMKRRERGEAQKRMEGKGVWGEKGVERKQKKQEVYMHVCVLQEPEPGGIATEYRVPSVEI